MSSTQLTPVSKHKHAEQRFAQRDNFGSSLSHCSWNTDIGLMDMMEHQQHPGDLDEGNGIKEGEFIRKEDEDEKIKIEIKVNKQCNGLRDGY